MTAVAIGNWAAELQSASPVVLLDVRREAARTASWLEIPGAIWRNPGHQPDSPIAFWTLNVVFSRCVRPWVSLLSSIAQPVHAR